MKTIWKSQRGIALVFVTISMTVIATALMMVMIEVQKGKKSSDQAFEIVVLEEAAQAGIELAVDTLWNDYLVNNGNTTGNWASYRYFLDSVLKIPKNEDLNFNGQRDPDEVGNGDTTFDTYPQGYDRKGWPLIEEPREFRDPESERLLATLEEVHVARYDTVARSVLTITATASVEGKTRTAVQLLEIGGQALPHTQFAILANNISCILCHAEIKSLPFEYNDDPQMNDSFDRIKVAALESLLVRRGSEPDSNIAGTLYTRGRLYDNRGNEMDAGDFSSSGFQSYSFSSENGKIAPNSSGNLIRTPFSNAEVNAEGNLTQFANLYMDYPENPDLQTDGPLPNSFPAPYPDENENRMVDDSEFDVIVNSANGRIDFTYADDEDVPGSIKAGVAYGVPQGGFYGDDTLPDNSNNALASLSGSGTYDGNLILVGTEDDPIQIDKTVAVNGDLVITGPVQGYGQILVRGNAYVVGDVTYKDDPGEFGQYTDENGNVHENAFALVAGGSIMMGDYLTVRGVNHSKDTSQYPDKSFSIHSREEHISKNKSNSGTTERLHYGYFDPSSVDAGEKTSGREGQQFSFTTSELKLFNNLELQKAIEDPSYTPRFYGLRESQPDNVYIWDSSEEHAVHYDRRGIYKLEDYLIDEGLPLNILDRAAFHYCNPEGNWMSEDTLRNIWFEDEMSRTSRGSPIRFDGLLYSNNSIWAIVRSYARHKSYTDGRMELRGGVIAADLGIFVPGNGGSSDGLNLYYDPRVERFLEIRDTSIVSFNRVTFYFLKGVQEV